MTLHNCWLPCGAITANTSRRRAPLTDHSTRDFFYRYEQIDFPPSFPNSEGHEPLQYQKWLRLNEGRRLMLTEGLDAATAAFRAGYESSLCHQRTFSHPSRIRIAFKLDPIAKVLR
jgi:hypothetical protein